MWIVVHCYLFAVEELCVPGIPGAMLPGGFCTIKEHIKEGWYKQFKQVFLFPFQIPLDTKTNEIKQQVEPHNDYFSTQFLLNFSILGTHTVTVEASVVDESGIEWKTGPKTTVSVKSLEDPYSQQLRHQLQQGGAQPPPQRAAYTRF